MTYYAVCRVHRELLRHLFSVRHRCDQAPVLQHVSAPRSALLFHRQGLAPSGLNPVHSTLPDAGTEALGAFCR